MGLDDLQDDVVSEFSDIDEDATISLDRESKNELAMLTAALEPEDTDELVRRAIHEFFQRSVETGNLDFQLRSQYEVTYDEYLSGMTYDEMTGGAMGAGAGSDTGGDPDDRRYQF